MNMHKGLLSIIIIPTFLIQLGFAVGSSFSPLYVQQLGSSFAWAAIIPALLYLGQAVSDIPGAILVIRFGERRILLLGSVLMISSMLLRIFTDRLAPFVISILFFGVGMSFVWLARISWMKKEIRGNQRGFAMSFVGGSLRLALILGPLIGGFIAEFSGYKPLFIVQTLLLVTALLFMVIFVPKSGNQDNSCRQSYKLARDSFHLNKKNIIAAIFGIGGLSILRSSRFILFPLWGSQIGLAESKIGVMMFIGALVDASFFWLSGLIMTHLGRKTSAILCTAVLALAIGLLTIANSYPILVILIVLAGLGNATGSGLVLTVSSDLAPGKSPEIFLGIWRFFQGLASFSGPAMAAWMINLAGSSIAAPATAAMGFAAAIVMVLFMKETGKKIR